ncbi:MAG: hypothetical protein IJR45_07180 [Firmicutes bacterium]|nr:hypothetical protein [Bacillota bacterium]MBQ9605177.1 hypothetical protein [Bacillota bacterium]
MKIKIEIEDFIYEVFEELICYDEIGEQGAKKWAADFENWLNDGRKKNNVVKNGEKTYFVIEDEGEIFDIADEYLEAVENNSLEKYWKDFQ